MSNQLDMRGPNGPLPLIPNQKKSSPINGYSGTIDSFVESVRPALPVYFLNPDRVAANARRFLALFPGTPAYAVKCNPDPAVLKAMARTGVQAFDAASIEEIRAVRKYAPKARILFMNPVKSREAIREAYYTHGVRAYSLDCVDELYKLLQETGLAPDLEIFVRIAIPKANATTLDLTGKFGVQAEDAPELLRQCRPVSARLGVCFHVGSQCMKPERYAQGIRLAAQVIKASGVKVDALDVGGGFPVEYPNMTPPALETYIETITQAVARNRLGGLDLICEPGRAMVGNSGAVVARVEQRKGNMLYLNDGTYGNLFDAGPCGNLIYPTRLIRPGGEVAANQQTYGFAGPTCDSIDMMKGPFTLPVDVREGDWIVIEQLGPYCLSMGTRFNGFGQTQMVVMASEKEKAKAAR